jgi:hypothetical protein
VFGGSERHRPHERRSRPDRPDRGRLPKPSDFADIGLVFDYQIAGEAARWGEAMCRAAELWAHRQKRRHEGIR